MPELTVAEGSAGLRISHLRKSYSKKIVIRDFSMELMRGEVVALLGPNGSGKTTTFYSVAGLVTPEGGTVMIDGKDVTTLPMYRRAQLGIGYLPQEMSIFRGLSVQENILAILDIVERDRQKKLMRLDELLSEFSIEHLRRAPALALSGGERRRVEIARCLAANPKYLLLDEPFAGVDPISVGDIRRPEKARHRRAHYRPQRTRNPRNCGPRLHPARGPRAHVWHPRRSREQWRCAPRISWR